MVHEEDMHGKSSATDFEEGDEEEDEGEEVRIEEEIEEVEGAEEVVADKTYGVSSYDIV
jgi:hypothetical protein